MTAEWEGIYSAAYAFSVVSSSRGPVVEFVQTTSASAACPARRRCAAKRWRWGPKTMRKSLRLTVPVCRRQSADQSSVRKCKGALSFRPLAMGCLDGTKWH